MSIYNLDKYKERITSQIVDSAIDTSHGLGTICIEFTRGSKEIICKAVTPRGAMTFQLTKSPAVALTMQRAALRLKLSGGFCGQGKQTTRGCRQEMEEFQPLVLFGNSIKKLDKSGKTDHLG